MFRGGEEIVGRFGLFVHALLSSCRQIQRLLTIRHGDGEVSCRFGAGFSSRGGIRDESLKGARGSLGRLNGPYM